MEGLRTNRSQRIIRNTQSCFAHVKTSKTRAAPSCIGLPSFDLICEVQALRQLWAWSVGATAPICLTTWVEAKLFSLKASTTKGIQDAGNQTNKESTELLPPSMVSNRASVGFLRPCFWAAAPSKGRQTTFTNPVGGLCFSCSLTALCRLEAHSNSV